MNGEKRQVTTVQSRAADKARKAHGYSPQVIGMVYLFVFLAFVFVAVASLQSLM